MYIPKFSITHKILRNIGIIEGAKEVIENAPMVPAWEARFREEAMLRMIHFGTKIEGNDLSFTDAEKVISGQQVLARERDIQEVLNYRNVVDYLGSLVDQGKGEEKFTFTQEILLDMHRMTTQRVIPDEETGKLRQVQVVLRNALTGEIGYRPPPAIEVKYLLDDFIFWLNSEEGREIHPVIRAAISHYTLTAIHPFVEGNGRTARAFATLVMFAEGYDTRRFFSLEEHFDADAAGYFGKLMEVSDQAPEIENRDLTVWIEFFAEALAIELTKIKDKVRQISVDVKIKERIGGEQVYLSERQMKLMEYLQSQKELTMQGAKSVIPLVSEDTLLRDLKMLMEKGIVKKEGVTKAARYVLA